MSDQEVIAAIEQASIAKYGKYGCYGMWLVGRTSDPKGLPPGCLREPDGVADAGSPDAAERVIEHFVGKGMHRDSPDDKGGCFVYVR